MTRVNPLSIFLPGHEWEDHEAGVAVKEVAEAVLATGKKGSVTIKVEIEPNGSGQNVTRTQVSVDVDKKVPRPAPEKATYWIAPAGLSKFDPSQRSLDEDLEAISVDTETGEAR